MIDGRKIAGILLESPAGLAPAKGRLIIGIGINVNNSWFGAPPEVIASRAALCDITGQQHDLQAILIEMLMACASRITQLQIRDAEIVRAWQRLDLLSGTNVVVESDGRRLEGKCLEIAPDGALVVETASGSLRTV